MGRGHADRRAATRRAPRRQRRTSGQSAFDGRCSSEIREQHGERDGRRRRATAGGADHGASRDVRRRPRWLAFFDTEFRSSIQTENLMTGRYDAFKYLAFDRPSDRVLRITINRPEKLNALPWEAHGELTRVWLGVDQDPDTNVAIIRGAGKAFCAGGDFTMVEGLTQDYQRQTEALREFRELCYNIVNCSKPIV